MIPGRGKSASATITELAIALIIIAVVLVALWYLLLRGRETTIPNQTLLDGIGMVDPKDDTADNAVRDLITPVPTLVPEPTPVAPALTFTPQLLTHIVAEGETLSEIADLYEIPWEELADFNEITDPRTLQVGQELLIPEGI